MNNEVKVLKLNIMGEGKHQVTAAEVRGVSLPEQTRSYCPLPHMQLVEMTHTHLKAHGFEVIGETFSLNQAGQHFFGVMQVHKDGMGGAEGIGRVVHIKNSYNRTIAATLGVGSAPFICTNLLMFAEDKLCKRHTSGMMGAIDMAIDQKIGGLLDIWAVQEAREAAWRDIPLTRREMEGLAIQSARQGFLPKTKILDVCEEFINPKHDFGGDTLYGGQQAFTEVFKQISPTRLTDSSSQLVRMLEAVQNRDADLEGWVF